MKLVKASRTIQSTHGVTTKSGEKFFRMNPRVGLLLAISGALLLNGQAQEANKASENPSTNKTIVELTVDLKDGSRLVGASLNDPWRFHSESLGDLQLPVRGIASLEFSGSANAAKLTATNGDVMNIQFVGKTFLVETSFGKAVVPAQLLTKVKVTLKNYGEKSELTNSLLSFWNFNGSNPADIQPDGGLFRIPLQTGNDGRGLVNQGVLVSGKIGGAIGFGQFPNQGLFIPLGAFPQLTTFTITAWVKLNRIGFGSARSLIACSWDGADGWNFYMDVLNNQLEGCVGIGGRDNSPRVATTGNFADSRWHFCVFQCLDASFIRVKVDNGNWVSAPLLGSLAGAGPRPFQIAQNIAQSVQASNFTIDMLGVWQSLLSDEEIALLYNKGEGLEYPFALPSP